MTLRSKDEEELKKEGLGFSPRLYWYYRLYYTFVSNTDLYHSIKLDFFSSYRLWIDGNAEKGRAILQNIALFIPLGYFTASLFSVPPGKTKKRLFLYTVLVGITISLLIETAQYSTGRGWFDIDDLFNNTLGLQSEAGYCF